MERYELEVFAEDCPWTREKCVSPAPSASFPSPSILRLAISVSDVNDNPPRFIRRHFFAPLLHPTTVGRDAVIELRAEDPDEMDGGQLRFGWGEGMVETESEVSEGIGIKELISLKIQLNELISSDHLANCGQRKSISPQQNQR